MQHPLSPFELPFPLLLVLLAWPLYLPLLVAAAVAAIWLLATRRRGDGVRSRGRRVVAIGSTAVLSTAVVVAASGAAFLWRTRSLPFDAREWRAVRGESCFDSNVRERMYSDLVRSHRLTDMSERQVIEILGPPDDRTPEGLEYEVGSALVDCIVLEVDLVDGRVASHRVVQH